MHHLVLIVGNFDHWQHLPTVVRGGGRLFLLADHRTPLAERCAAINQAAGTDGIGSFDYIVADPVPCRDAHVHLWAPLNEGREVVAGRCVGCGYVELLPEPYPAPNVVGLHAR